MDAYQDTMRAFDALIEWLGEPPDRIPIEVQGKQLYALRHPGEYGSELRKRCDAVLYFLNEMIQDGLELPLNYLWRRFQAVAENGCRYEYDNHGNYDQAGRDELIRVISCARDDVVERTTGRAVAPPPQPHMTDDQYEEALSVIRAWAEGVERSPANVRALDEEGHRSNCLTVLNSRYRGRATGETFNKQGKTDIFLRVADGPVFVAEFKIWAGPAGLKSAIDQLLGYLTWRDTKSALVVINRTGDLTRVVQSATRAAGGHERHVDQIQHRVANESRHVFMHPDDDQRLVIVTLMVVEVAD